MAATTTSSLTNRGDAQCMESLKSFGIADVKAFDHDTVKTVDEWKTQLPKLPDGTRLAKNMFLKGKKGEQVLVVALAETPTDLKVVCRVTGSGSGNLRFAAEDVLNKTLGVVQGAVTPLALINDTAKACTVVLDKALIDCKELVAFHPCRNDQSVCIVPAKLNEWITNHLSYKPVVVDFAAEAAAAPAPAPKKDGAAAASKKKEPKVQEKAPQPEAGETRLGLEYKKMENFPMWYQQLITKAELIEYYDVSGCYILRPAAYAIWEFVQRFLDDHIKSLDVQNCYFPMFISQGALEREKDHVEGFAPEVAWVTRAGQSDLEQPIAIRPTSETVMYPTFAKWIRSHRDLPLKLNQWCNVVRWEFSNPTPFIRTREFLWQEGHTAHATKEEADVEVKQILDFYRRVYEELLAVPCECGIKTEKEKFAGGLYTTTVETFVPAVGRGCQGATSHCLGQNFGKMFDITFEDPAKNDGSKLIPWQNSWGMTTRTIGVMLMNHADDTGLVLPPRVAQVQVVIVPVGVTANTSDADRKNLQDACTAIGDKLRAAGVRCKDDLRTNVTPGWKFNNWELKGVPIRIEVGPKELAKNVLTLARRFDGKKDQVPASGDEMVAAVQKQLTDIQAGMLERATAQRRAQTVRLTSWEEFVPALNNRCAILAPWCGSMKCEDRIKDQSADEAKALAEANDERAPSMGAKSLCIPFNQPTDKKASEFTCICPGCKESGKEWVLFGRSY